MSIVTTYFEMRLPGQLRPARCTDERFRIRQKREPDWRFNRDLYFAVGERWSWIAREFRVLPIYWIDASQRTCSESRHGNKSFSSCCRGALVRGDRRDFR